MEAELLGEHQRHFRRRVRPLDPSFFPGGERSDDAIESLGHGAFASFASEPTHEGKAAFTYALDKAFSPPTGFLYYWRASATIQFLRREGPEVLRARASIQRNVRLHMQEAFAALEGGMETRWALPEWGEAQRREVADVDGLTVDLAQVGRGKAMLRAVLDAAGAPLTRAQICAVIERSAGFAREVAAAPGVEFGSEALVMAAEASMARRQLAPAVQAFVQSMSADEVAVLRARGYMEPGRKLTSFRDVARQLPHRGAETWRLKEREVLERLRDRFDAEDLPEVITLLVERLGVQEAS